MTVARSFLILFFCLFQVEIWDERKVFGSRGRGLKDEILGNAPILVSDNGKSTNPIKFVRKDANFVRIVSRYVFFPVLVYLLFLSYRVNHLNSSLCISFMMFGEYPETGSWRNA